MTTIIHPVNVTSTLLAINGNFVSFWEVTMELSNNEIVTFYKSYSPKNRIGIYTYYLENLLDKDPYMRDLE